jgi:hypothetical protein
MLIISINKDRMGICVPEGTHNIKEVKELLLSLRPDIASDPSLIQIWIEREEGFGTVLKDDDIAENNKHIDFTVKGTNSDLVGRFKI